YDILAIQEPYINPINLTTSNSKWDVVYPSTHYSKPADTHSVILVSKALSKNKWRAITVDSADITALELDSEGRKIRIYNLY
ncbi:hypothetical protein BJ138DRAFT_972966, partial [Hygrophoropsis aurantiaca]